MSNELSREPPPRIVCDANMPFAREAFETLGSVRLIDGREIRAEDVREADLLLTRSTTRVNRALLSGSRVRFYATATIGYDHVDVDELDARGIVWTTAAGCNAESVAQYVTAALTRLSLETGRPLHDRTLGVIGVGNVGRRVVQKARALGLRVVACDPPRQRDPEDGAARDFVPLETLLAEADIVTFHVPLNREGPDRTEDMAGRAFFDRLRPDAWLINAARGEIVREDELVRAIEQGRIAHAVVDTWKNEPDINRSLLARATLATPHIAGHSLEGKVNGTILVYAAACRFLGMAPRWQCRLPSPPVPVWSVPPELRSAKTSVQVEALVRATYDIRGDDRRLRDCAATPEAAALAGGFDRLRKNYPVRREFGATRVEGTGDAPDVAAQARALGFEVA